MILSIPGACLSVLSWGTGGALGMAVAPFLVGGAVQAVRCSHGSASGTFRSRERVPALGGALNCGRTALAAGVIAVGLVGLGAVSVSGAGLIVLLMGTTTPPAVARLRRSLVPGEPVRREQTLAAPPVPPPPTHSLLEALLVDPAHLMSPMELCRAWRLSFTALQGARTLEERMWLVKLRQSYLDEIEARDAATLVAWLSAGAGAADGPDRYFTDGDRHPPDAA